MSGIGYVEGDVKRPVATAVRPDYTPLARAERLIATGRFILAFSSLMAVWIEPSTPAKFQQVTYALLAVYTAYALVTVFVAWRSAVPRAAWRIASHGGDLALFTGFVYLTEGPASPFFLYFIFSLFSATLRFSWRGVLVTGVTAMAVYGGMAVLSSYTDPAFEASRSIIRIAYLGVITALLVHLGFYQQQLRAELTALAAWPRELAAQLDEALCATLRHAAALLRAPRLFLLWEDNEEPWVHLAVFTGGSFRTERLPPATYESHVPEGVRHASVFMRGDEPTMLVYDPEKSGVMEVPGDAIGEQLRREHGIERAIVVPLESETLTARLIVPDVAAATADDLTLARVAGRLVLATLEQFLFLQQVRQTASAEERLRISRDLHDGIVQSLAGIGLRLQAVRTHQGHDEDLARELKKIQTVLEHDQRELRAIVRELRPQDARDGQMLVAQELERMRERYPLEWGLEVDVAASGLERIPSRVGRDVCRIVNESLANAARHGGASRAVVAVSAFDGRVDIRVCDNGHGFPFAGRLDLPTLEQTSQGPRTLKERVRSLQGSMVVESSPSGAAIEIRIPVREESR